MSSTSRRLVLALRLLALAIIGLHLAAPLFSESTAWGLWPATYLAPGWRWALAILAAGLVCFGPSLGSRLPLQRLADLPASAAPWLRAGLAVAAAAPFYLFRIQHTRWGDAFILVQSIPHPQVHLTYSWQAPLDVFLHAKTWALGQRLFGWTDAMPAYWLLSTLAGVVFVWALLGLARWLGRDRTERVLLFGLVITLGTVQLFFGYIENYTLMTVAVLIYAWLALRCLRREVSPAWPATALALANGLHPATLVFGPSLLYVGWQAGAGPACPVEPLIQSTRLSGWRQHARPFALMAIPYAAVGLGVLGLMTAGGHGLATLFGTDAPGGGDHRWLVPLLHTATKWEHYTMFSLGHLGDVVNEQLLSAPVILPGLILAFGLARPRLRNLLRPAPSSSAAVGAPLGVALDEGQPSPGPAAIRWDDRHPAVFLGLMGAAALLLILVWNPDYGGQRDWDLFALASVPAALLLAYVLPRALPERPALRAAAWALIAAQAFHTVAWIYQNTRPWSWS